MDQRKAKVVAVIVAVAVVVGTNTVVAVDVETLMLDKTSSKQVLQLVYQHSNIPTMRIKVTRMRHVWKLRNPPRINYQGSRPFSRKLETQAAHCL